MAQNRYLLNSGTHVLKAGTKILVSTNDAPVPILEIDPNKWVFNNNEAVPNATDTSGNELHGFQNDPAKRAIFKTNQINGYPALYFNGSNDGSGNGMYYQFTQNIKAATLFFVVKASDVQRATEGLLGDATDNGQGWISTSLYGGTNRWFSFNTTNSGYQSIGNYAYKADPTIGFNRCYINNSNAFIPTDEAIKTENWVLLTIDLAMDFKRLVGNPDFTFQKLCYDSKYSFGGWLAYFCAYSGRLRDSERRAKQTELVTRFNL